MMRCKEMLSVLALVAPLAVGAVVASLFTAPSEASANRGTPHLCASTIGVCEYGPIEDSPELRADVCWDGTDVTLMPATGCTGGGRAYIIDHGIVDDPIRNTVLAIAPVIDTCVAGYCMADQIGPSDIIIDGVACCNPKTGDCSAPDENGVCTMGDVTWCKQLEDNGDGTVTCHE